VHYLISYNLKFKALSAIFNISEERKKHQMSESCRKIVATE